MYVANNIPVVENLKVQSFTIDKHFELLWSNKKFYGYQINLHLYNGEFLKYAIIPRSGSNQYTYQDLRDMEQWAERRGLRILSKQSIIETKDDVANELKEDIRQIFGITIL